VWSLRFLDRNSQQICSCLRGSVPWNIEEWSIHNWTGGCVKKTPLECERINNKTTDFAEGVAVMPDICRSLCLHNCSCVAYSHDSGIGCMSWTGNLLDIHDTSTPKWRTWFYLLGVRILFDFLYFIFIFSYIHIGTLLLEWGLIVAIT